MKFVSFVFALLLFQPLFAQTGNSRSPIPVFTDVTSPNTYGYLQGKRLDSIDATYATISWRNNKQVSFDYGQPIPSIKDFVLTDRHGNLLAFPVHSHAFLLNFFHYNHWEYLNGIAAEQSIIWVLQKRR